MREIKRDIVSGILISVDEKILMGKKDPKKGGVYPNAWHLPGGGVKTNESLEAALVREVGEETGIDITGIYMEMVDDKGSGKHQKTLESGEKVLANMKFYVFIVNLQQQSTDVRVMLQDDLVEYRWFSSDELSGIELIPPLFITISKTHTAKVAI